MSDQYPIDFSNKDPVDAVCEAIDQYPHEFRPEFFEWLRANWHLWRAFEREARRTKARGFQHYSARTIWEFLRHHTALQERDVIFKINNNYAPDCARLLMLAYPEFYGFFERRVRTAAA